MSKSRKSYVSRMESDSPGRNNQHELLQHIIQLIDKIDAEKTTCLCLKSLWLLIQKENIGIDQLYMTICGLLRNTNLIEDSPTRVEHEPETIYSRTAMLYVLKIVAYGFIICDNLSSTRPTDVLCDFEWSRYRRDFEELQFIAEGAFGSVFKARHRFDCAEYAIKKAFIKWSSNFGSVIKEVKIMASFNHPNVVTYKAAWLEPMIESTTKKRKMKVDGASNLVLDDEESDEDLISYENNGYDNVKSSRDLDNWSPFKMKGVILYIQMFCCKKTLRQWLDDRRQQNMNISRNCSKSSIVHHGKSACAVPSDMKVLIDMFMQLVNGLHYIHSRGIIHDDVNADNVLLTQDEDGCSVQLCDFGLAYPAVQHSHSEMALETQWQGNNKGDMISLGTILLELVEPSKSQRELRKIIDDLQKGCIPAHMAAGYPEIAHILTKLFQESPSQRFGTAELLEELKNLWENKYCAESYGALKAELAEKNEEIARLKMMLNQSQV